MDAEPNSIDLSTAERVAVEGLLAGHWGAGDVISRLPGENLNLLVRSEDGRRSVLKITTDESADVELEEAILDALEGSGIAVPSVIPDRAGERIVRFDLNGVDARARMQRFLPGSAWRDAAATPELGRSIGRMLAEVHAALAGFEHAGAERSHAWDLATGRMHRGSIVHVESSDRRTMLESIMQEHAAIVEPLLGQCPRAPWSRISESPSPTRPSTGLPRISISRRRSWPGTTMQDPCRRRNGGRCFRCFVPDWRPAP
ncbi:MAG: phosphotransferase [Planctomycetota bacterium]|jgi:Ser/Thr protein kinase RdoA (MazF antagonist)